MTGNEIMVTHAALPNPIPGTSRVDTGPARTLSIVPDAPDTPTVLDVQDVPDAPVLEVREAPTVQEPAAQYVPKSKGRTRSSFFWTVVVIVVSQSLMMAVVVSTDPRTTVAASATAGLVVCNIGLAMSEAVRLWNRDA